jgi:DNA-binding IclR family transcriptional regulator
LGTRAQISIDILIRNLFERTADVGFLAEDGAIIDSLGAAEPDLEALRQRLDEYVAKYSVYDDIAVFRTDGALHVTRLEFGSRFGAHDPLVTTALGAPGSFREIFRTGPDGTAQLLYVQTIPGPNRAPIGVLALSFKFDDEMRGIFGSLLKGASPGLMLGIVDSDGRIIASSDRGGLAIGTRLEIAADKLVTLTLGEKKAYLGLRRPTRGYQGFFGLGWSGVALRPAVQRKSEIEAGEPDAGEEHDGRAIADSAIVSDALKQISRRAYAIDSDLHLIGLNGKIAADRENNRVLPAVLGSIREVGEQIRNAVHSVIGALYDQTHGSLRGEAEQMAALGVDIMDRNLYERANDGRWWALTPYFRTALAGGAPDAGEIGRILATINGLYTVYSTLFVFDATGRVIADSRNGASGMVGERLAGPHIEAALAGRNTQAYAVSAFEATPLYDGRPTYIYCGSILAPDSSRTVGGVAIVFDGEPQFRQMLLDVLPVNDSGAPYPGSFAAFVNAAGTVIAATDPQRKPGSTLDEAKLDGFQIVARGRSPGYREFKTTDGYRDPITCLVAIPG